MRVAAGVILGLGFAALAGGQARAAADLVTNGTFEATSLGSSYQISRPAGPYSAVTGTTVTGWTNAGYNFLFLPGTADTSGAFSPEFNTALKLWGPNDGGGANGLTASSAAGNTGGNFIAADGGFEAGAISQMINGLVVGWAYQLQFLWATGQQAGFGGATTESWKVTFGDSSPYVTATQVTPDKGFTPWRRETVNFTATSTSQLLSFLAMGAPSGQPPFSLLDSVSLVATPEPATWAMMLVGVAGLGFVASRRRRGTGALPA